MHRYILGLAKTLEFMGQFEDKDLTWETLLRC